MRHESDYLERRQELTRLEVEREVEGPETGPTPCPDPESGRVERRRSEARDEYINRLTSEGGRTDGDSYPGPKE